MATPKLIKKQILLCKIESTYRTDPTPVVSADELLVQNFTWSFVNQRMEPQPAMKATLGAKKHLYGGALMQLTFDVLIKGSGTAGTAPEFGPVLRSCNLGETIVAGTSVTYAPVSSSTESSTLWFYEDGQLYKVVGCRGNVSFDLSTGKPGVISFTMTGHFTAETDTALPTAVYDSTVSVPILTAGFSADSYSAVISKLAFDLGNVVATPDDINQSDGYGEIVITDRDVNGSFDPEKVLVATYDFISKWQGNTAFSLSTGVIGGTAGNKYAVTLGAISYRDVAPGDRDGIRTYEMPFGAAESSGDDEMSFPFT